MKTAKRLLAIILCIALLSGMGAISAFALEIGDEIATVGGIVGNVVSIKEDTVVIETGSDRSKIRILKGAVAQVREKA